MIYFYFILSLVLKYANILNSNEKKDSVRILNTF